MVTLDLIATNVYNSVSAPKARGFSYIEIWFLGVQVPILVAIFEYGILLTMKRYISKKNLNSNMVSINFDKMLKVESLKAFYRKGQGKSFAYLK